MNALRISIATRSVLLPVILTVSMFLVCLGMRTPDLGQTQKPKGYNRAVVENQMKAVKTGIEKSGPVAEMGCRAELVEPLSFYTSSLRYVVSNINPTLIIPLPSRAPPAA